MIGKILQLNTGGFRGPKPSVQKILTTLERCMTPEVCGLIIGWNTDREIYQAVFDSAGGKIPVWLWLPVFSETGDLTEVDPSVGLWGGSAASIAQSEGENFLFACPASEKNRMAPLQIYDTYFSGLPFEGVFLDKVRFAAFSNGYEDGFGCFCPRCTEKYRTMGVDTEALRKQLADHPILELSGMEHGRYGFKDPAVNMLFQARAELMTESIAAVAEGFRRRGLKVGLDSFAPLLAWFVGQDIPKLAEIADFIKPMMYRVTEKPAGIPFETRAVKECLGVDPAALWEGELLSDASCFAQLSGFPGLCPGLEVNRMDGCPSDPEYIAGTLKLSEKAGCSAAVLAWDICSAPEDNLNAALGQIGEES